MPVIRRMAQAEEDLIEIWIYIAQDNPVAADELLEEIERKCSLLADNPYLGPAREDIAEDCRYSPVGNYLILYRWAWPHEMRHPLEGSLSRGKILPLHTFLHFFC